MKKRLSLASLFVAFALCFIMGFAAAITNVRANEALKTVDEITFVMENGANVRYATTESESGLRFEAEMSATDYTALMNNVGDGKAYSEMSFGVMIMPYDYIEKYGDLTVENLFGTDAKYDWAEMVDGEWQYDGSKVRIINITGDAFSQDLIESENMVFRGAISGILQDNLARDFIGRGYIKYKVSGESEYKYLMAEYADDKVHSNVRSIIEVAEAAYADVETETDEKNDLKSYYLDKTNVRLVKFFDGDRLALSHKSALGYTFDGEIVMLDQDGYKFARWVNGAGETVSINESYTVNGTEKVYAVYTKGDQDYVEDGYLNADGAVITAINEFLALEISSENLATAKEKFEAVNSAIEVIREDEYKNLISDEVAAQLAAQIEVLNAVEALPENANVNTVTLYTPAQMVNYMTVLGIEHSRNNATSHVGKTLVGSVATNNFAEGAAYYAVSSIGAANDYCHWTVSLPKINFTNLKTVTFNWRIGGAWNGISFESPRDDGMAFTSNNHPTGTVNIEKTTEGISVTISCPSLSKTVNKTITDSDIISGNKALEIVVMTGNSAATIEFAAIMATTLYGYNEVTDNKNLFRGETLLNGVATEDMQPNATDGADGALTIDSTKFEGGIKVNTVGDSANVNVSLPKINYNLYDVVTLAWAFNVPNSSIGWDANVLAPAQDATVTREGTITVTNTDGKKITVTIFDEKSNESISQQITDVAIINGTSAITINFSNSREYGCLYLGPISSVYSSLGKMTTMEYAPEVSALAEKTWEVPAIGFYDTDAKEEDIVIDDALIAGLTATGDAAENHVSGAHAHDKVLNAWLSASNSIIYSANHDTNSGVSYTAWKINLPKLNFNLYETVTINWSMSKIWSRIGLTNSSDIGASGSTQSGTIVITNNGDGTITAVLTGINSSGTATCEKTYTDIDVVSGNVSIPVYVDMSYADSNFSISGITGTRMFAEVSSSAKA